MKKRLSVSELLILAILVSILIAMVVTVFYPSRESKEGAYSVGLSYAILSGNVHATVFDRGTWTIDQDDRPRLVAWFEGAVIDEHPSKWPVAGTISFYGKDTSVTISFSSRTKFKMDIRHFDSTETGPIYMVAPGNVSEYLSTLSEHD